MTGNKIKQREFVEATGLRATDIPPIREKYLSEGEWWKEGVTIFWDRAAAYRVKAILEAEKQQPTAQAGESDTISNTFDVSNGDGSGGIGADAGVDTADAVGTAEVQAETPVVGNRSGMSDMAKTPLLTARVLKRARNYRFVYASFEGERIAVFCPKKGRQNIIGKNVRISKTVVDGETKYTLIP